MSEARNFDQPNVADAVARLAARQGTPPPDPMKGERVLGRDMASLIGQPSNRPHPVTRIGAETGYKREDALGFLPASYAANMGPLCPVRCDGDPKIEALRASLARMILVRCLSSDRAQLSERAATRLARFAETESELARLFRLLERET